MSGKDYSNSEQARTPMDASGLKPPVSVAALRGPAWIREGLSLWRKSPLNFTAMGLAATLIFVGVQLVPLVGAILALIFWPHLSAGLYLALRHALEDKPVQLGDLLQPFRQPGPLAMLGSTYLVLSIVLMVTVFALMAGQVGMEQLQLWMEPQEGGFDQATLQQVLAELVWPILAGVVLTLLLFMAFAFAPLLVHQHSKKTYEAIGLSFMACLRALPAFILWALCWMGIFMLASLLAVIPVAGGPLYLLFMLVVVVFMTASLYSAYLDLFIRD
ncbi:MAG: hypothetical protein EA349_03240 [Halomonadaceae bacterium]|nr:MAG: hypothetical protein EA349_03240 [Halomonadaceae bacterium]